MTIHNNKRPTKLQHLITISVSDTHDYRVWFTESKHYCSYYTVHLPPDEFLQNGKLFSINRLFELYNEYMIACELELAVANQKPVSLSSLLKANQQYPTGNTKNRIAFELLSILYRDLLHQIENTNSGLLIESPLFFSGFCDLPQWDENSPERQRAYIDHLMCARAFHISKFTTVMWNIQDAINLKLMLRYALNFALMYRTWDISKLHIKETIEKYGEPAIDNIRIFVESIVESMLTGIYTYSLAYNQVINNKEYDDALKEWHAIEFQMEFPIEPFTSAAFVKTPTDVYTTFFPRLEEHNTELEQSLSNRKKTQFINS